MLSSATARMPVAGNFLFARGNPTACHFLASSMASVYFPAAIARPSWATVHGVVFDIFVVRPRKPQAEPRLIMLWDIGRPSGRRSDTVEPYGQCVPNHDGINGTPKGLPHRRSVRPTDELKN